MMNTDLRKQILAFLTPLPMLQSENGRKVMLLSAGLEEILPHVDLSGPTGQSLTLLVNALEHYGTVENEPALMRFLWEIAKHVGTDKQAMIEGMCELLLANRTPPPQPAASRHTEATTITTQGDYFEHIEGHAQVFTAPVTIYHNAAPNRSHPDAAHDFADSTPFTQSSEPKPASVTKSDLLQLLYQAYQHEPDERVSSGQIQQQLTIDWEPLRNMLIALR